MDKIQQIENYIEDELKDAKESYNRYQEQHKGKGFDDEVVGWYESRITILEDILESIYEIINT